MSLLSQTQELVEIAELESRDVEVALVKGNSEHGVLHAISDHGILIKSTDGYYLLVPWCNIKWVKHYVKGVNITESDPDLAGENQTEPEDPILKDVSKEHLRFVGNG